MSSQFAGGQFAVKGTNVIKKLAVFRLQFAIFNIVGFFMNTLIRNLLNLPHENSYL
ncbi:hypothetical protein GCM10022210_42470 [Mucilaginibacter dorajii]|uniref:Uncharacterized protein n=1 Tax=Mucilaginibacter dorajii TaxID=692994 RepID=A0ABP7QPM5_9SPHI